MTAIGISVVFILLTLLVGIIRGMSGFCRMIEARMPPAPEAAPAPTATGAATSQELISVIGAAVAAYRKRR